MRQQQRSRDRGPRALWQGAARPLLWATFLLLLLLLLLIHPSRARAAGSNTPAGANTGVPRKDGAWRSFFEAARQLRTKPRAKSTADRSLEKERQWPQTVFWTPEPGKYLLLYCSSGRLSNQVACMRRTLHLAAVLNRTLLVPPHGVLFWHGRWMGSYDLDMVVDWGRMRGCLEQAYGPRTVMRVEEFLKRHPDSRKVVVRKVHCLSRPPVELCVRPRRQKALMEVNGRVLEFPALEDYPNWIVPSCPKTHGLGKGGVPESAILRSLGHVRDEVLWVGEMFGFGFDRREVPGFFDYERPAECNNLWRPQKVISKFVQATIGRILGEDYLSVHLRRGDFYEVSLKARGPNAAYANYTSIAELARVMANVAEGSNPRTLYLATDASHVEVGLFKSLLTGLSGVKEVYTMGRILEETRHQGRSRWGKAFLELASSDNADVPLILADKSLCAQAAMFLGTKFSSFSMDIQEMRCNERRWRGWDESSLSCWGSRCSPVFC